MSLTVRDAERVGGIARSPVIPTTELVERLRVVKAPEEVAAIRSAATLAQEALAEVLPTVRVGQTELEVGADAGGGTAPSGQRVAPVPDDRGLGPALGAARTRGPATARSGPGEWLLLDFGAQVDGYCADLTRTVVVGARADERQRTMYELVRSAQATRRRAPGGRDDRPGSRRAGPRRDRRARLRRRLRPLAGPRAGSGGARGAAPRADRGGALCPSHAVVTVEPGIYLPGWGGVRLEDDVYLGPTGPSCLSDGRTELIELV